MQNLAGVEVLTLELDTARDNVAVPCGTAYGVVIHPTNAGRGGVRIAGPANAFIPWGRGVEYRDGSGFDVLYVSNQAVSGAVVEIHLIRRRDIVYCSHVRDGRTVPGTPDDTGIFQVYAEAVSVAGGACYPVIAFSSAWDWNPLGLHLDRSAVDLWLVGVTFEGYTSLPTYAGAWLDMPGNIAVVQAPLCVFSASTFYDYVGGGTFDGPVPDFVYPLPVNVTGDPTYSASMLGRMVTTNAGVTVRMSAFLRALPKGVSPEGML